MTLTIQKLEPPVHCGDWHDPPLRWEVLGPGNERQLFSTKKDAEAFRRDRKNSVDFYEAMHKWMRRK